jgi:hypothetical protein
MTYAPVSCFHSTLNRRGVMRLAAAAAATGLQTQTGQAVARQAAGTALPEPFDGKTFVGVTSDPGLFIALVAGPEEARGYLCNGTSSTVWCSGAAGSTLHLHATNGDEMTAHSIAGTLQGEASLADGRTLSFTAAPATGIAGLYEIVISDGRVAGAAAGGRRLAGVVAGSLPDGTLLIAATVSTPDGGVRPLAVFSTPDAAGEQRWIVLDDGRVTGAFKSGRGSGFIDPTNDLAMPTDELFGYIDPTTDI